MLQHSCRVLLFRLVRTAAAVVSFGITAPFPFVLVFFSVFCVFHVSQILLRSLEQQEEGEGQEEDGPLLAPDVPISLGGVVRAHNLARRLKRSAMASAAQKVGVSPITVDHEDDEYEDDEDDDNNGASSTADLNAASIAKIAVRARCQEALSFLHFVKRVREEKREDAAAAAAAGHGWDWVEDNCRCGPTALR